MRSHSSAWTALLTKLGLSRKKRCSRLVTKFGRRLRFEQCEDRRMLALFTVTSLADNTIGGDGFMTLREAIDQAEQLAGHDTIEFSTNPAHGLDGATIELALGQLNISESVTIDASMLPAGITIDAGNGADDTFGTGDGIRIFNITDPTSGSAPPSVSLIGLTLTGGDVAGQGGAIRSQGLLSLQDCTIDENFAWGGGGIAAITSYATLEIQSSHITGNQSSTRGGIEAYFALAV